MDSAGLGAAFGDVTLWVFDLDNTLYARPPGLWEQIDRKMSGFIAEALEVDLVEARRLQKDYLHRYGLTVRGLMLHHDIRPEDFLFDVHDVDLSPIAPNPALGEVIAALPGRRVIHTNSDVKHTERVLARLGFPEGVFHAVYDIAATRYEPKPERSAYDHVLNAEGADPARAAMFEDAARNLVEPHRRGMRTVWTPTGCDWASHGAADGHVHHIAEDMTEFVSALAREVAR